LNFSVAAERRAASGEGSEQVLYTRRWGIKPIWESNPSSTVGTKAEPVKQGQANGWIQTTTGERYLIRTFGAETEDVFSVVEIVADPRDSTPLHIHQNEDERYDRFRRGSAHRARFQKHLCH
jgi:hypothetical protein